MDARHIWLAAAIAAHYGTQEDNERVVRDLAAPENAAAVCSFLDTSVTLLYASVSGQPGALKVTASSTLSEGNAQRVTFLKTRAAELTATLMPTEVIVSATSVGLEQSLFQLLHNVYVPLLSSSSTISTQAQDLLCQLDSSLGSSLQQGKGMPPYHCLFGIQTPLDEVRLLVPLC
jgi:hypothetical protein